MATFGRAADGPSTRYGSTVVLCNHAEGSKYGAMASAFTAYAQPLVDQTDGSLEQVQKALNLAQICSTLAQFPENSRDAAISEMQSSLEMTDEEFDLFRRSLILPMIQRHEEMFPRLQRRHLIDAEPSSPIPTLSAQPKSAVRAEAYPGTDRYAPCPCNSGEKYKFCCGKRR